MVIILGAESHDYGSPPAMNWPGEMRVLSCSGNRTNEIRWETHVNVEEIGSLFC
jgi:hypothetical protein